VVLFAGEPEPQPAPNFTLVSLDGETVRLSDYRGRAVVVDFWASWCKPCTRTLPALHELLEGYGGEVELLLVSLDKSEKASRDAMEAAGYSTGNVLWGSLAEAREVKSLFGVVGIPWTFLIDGDGLIRYAGLPSGLTADVIDLALQPTAP